MSTLGETLQEAREKKGLSMETVAKALRIKVQRLRDLESGNYNQFPAQIYARSFIRQYADYLGLDSTLILERFAQENPPSEPRPIFEITEDQRTNSPIQRHIPQSSVFFLTNTGKAITGAVVVVALLMTLSVWFIDKQKNLHRESLDSLPSQESTPSTPEPPLPQPPEPTRTLEIPSDGLMSNAITNLPPVFPRRIP